MTSGKDLWIDAKNIPILLVAEALNIDVKRNKAMCFGGHDKKSPSLSFSPDKNLWHCFGCGLGGTTVDLVAKTLEISPLSAAKWLALHFNRTSTSHTITKGFRDKPTLYTHNESITTEELHKSDSEVYAHLLQLSPLQKSGQEYLGKTRKLLDSTIASFQIGQITNPGKISQILLNKWGEERLLKCGLFKITEEKITKFVWWDEVLLFPFFDDDNKIIYFQARRLKRSDPKYVNLSKIRKPLFNSQILSKLPDRSRVYICEGIPDTIAATECGMNAIGVLGANSFDKKWVSKLINFEIFVIPDADSAGEKMFKSIQDAFRKVGKPIEALIIPPGKDFSDVFCTFK